MAYYGRDYNRNRYNRFGPDRSGYDYGFAGGYGGFGRWNTERNRGWDEGDRDRGFGNRGTNWGQQRDFGDRWNSSGQGWGRNFDDEWGGPQRYYGGGYGYGNQPGRGTFNRPDRGYSDRGGRGFYGRDRDQQMRDYDEDFGDKVRRGWHHLRDEARDWMGRGYDRGW